MPVSFLYLLGAALRSLALPAAPGAEAVPTARFVPGAASTPCDTAAGFHLLDFWLGDWTVRDASTGAVDGTNRIERILEGCAVVEHWSGAAGDVGMSLFYYLPAVNSWRQVWVTGEATRPGGVKEKHLVARFGDGSIRFQGEIPLGDGRSYLDRTTLSPAPDGRVRQVIEVSRDGGTTWRVVYDAWYQRR